MSPETSAGEPPDASPETLRPPSNRLVLANAAVKALAAALAFGLQIVLVKILGETEYGAYVLFVTYCLVLSILGRGGLDLITLRYFAAACSSGETGRLRSTRSRALLHVALYSLLAVGLAQLVSLIPGLHFRFGGGTAAAWMIPAVLSSSLLLVASGMLRGVRRVLLAESLDSVVRPVVLLLLAFVGAQVLSLGGLNAGLAAFVGSNVLVGLGILVLVNMAIAKYRAGPSPPAFSSPFRLKPALVLTAAGLLSYGLFQLDTLVVGFYLGERAVAGYAMACNFVRLVIFAALIISGQSQPLLAAAFGNGQMGTVRHITLVALRNSVAAAIVGVVVLVAFGRPLLRAVSASFATAYSALVVLSVADLANTLVIVLSTMLVMCRREAVVMRAQAAGLCVCIPLLFVLVPRLGQLGAAVAVLASLVVVTSIVVVQARDLYWPRRPSGPSPEPAK